jgi:hypothetical protein
VQLAWGIATAGGPTLNWPHPRNHMLANLAALVADLIAGQLPASPASGPSRRQAC